MKIYILIIIVLLMIFLFLKKTIIEKFENKPITFLHIPKNGGTYIKSYFTEFKNKPHYDSFPKNNETNIAILRNPTTRLQSIFSHIKYRDLEKNSSNDLNDFKTLDDLAKAYYDKNNIHHHKAHNILDWDMVKFKDYKNLKECGKNHSCIHWAPQHFYIEGHNANVEHIMKFETLNSDIKKLQKKHILKNVKIIENDIVRKTPDKYKKLTTITPLCEKLINDVYKRDIELWNNL